MLQMKYRKRIFKVPKFRPFERPLSGKACIRLVSNHGRDIKRLSYTVPDGVLLLRFIVLICVTAIILCACGGAGSGATAVIPGRNNPVVTALHDIQGNGSTSPMAGRDVTVRGIVTGDFQNSDADTRNELGGFYLQEENPDADPTTSDGVFVFDGSNPAVDVNDGDRVTVDGVVNEHFGETQISAVRVEVIVAGAGVIPETEVNLPATAVLSNSDGDLIADLESVEGMLVRFPQELAVTSLFGMERYGEILLSQNGRPVHFTNKDAPSVAGYAADQSQIAARRIMLDDGLSIQNASPIPFLKAPFAVRIGDSVSNLTGNIRFSRGSGGSGIEIYRLVPTSEPSFVSVNPRPATTPDVGGTLTVASYNLDNFFTTIDTGQRICGPSGSGNCRGAHSQPEFGRQLAKTVSALVQLDADIVALSELENNPTEATESLVNGLNAATGAGTYAYVNTGTIGTDAIRVGFLYKPAIVATSGVFAVLDSNVDQRFDDTRNRPTLAQSFVQNSNGAIFTVATNHLKSKSSDCSSVGDPDLNDGQSKCNVTRTDAAAAMADWLASDPTASGDPDVLIIGDLNAYLQEDPVTTLEAAGYANLLENFLGSKSYSYVFEGKAGAIDHALASPSLVGQVTGVREWHINADESPVHDYNLEFDRDADIFDGSSPYRASDHDPIVVGLNLTN
jgi:predicted extracellular nuclease